MPSPSRSIAFRERIGLLLVLTVIAFALAKSDWLWRLDQLFYDTQLQFWSRPAADDIVIIAIDEASLRRFGRWPWPRDLHASLLNRLTAEQPRAVTLDIIFAEPNLSDPRGDQLLAEAIKRNAHVILPVLMEQERAGGQPIESLPLPELAEVAAALGHVHVELDPDGIARSLYLREGIGQAHWPHLSLATLSVGGAAPDLDTPADTHNSPMFWSRALPMRIPYAGPPGHFKRISYAQVIAGEYAAGTFKDKYVLVGTTAAGIGDALPTPMSGHSRAMPGVEINANILSALREGLRISPLTEPAYMLLCILIAALPMLIYPFLAPRATLLMAGALILLTFIFSAALLWFGNLWFPPAAALFALILSYPLWSWRRLEYAMRYLTQELDELTRQRSALAITHSLNIKAALRFMSDILPIRGWVLHDLNGQLLEQYGTAPQPTTAPIYDQQWNLYGSNLWHQLDTTAGTQMLGLAWHGNDQPTAQEYALLDALVQELTLPTNDISSGSSEVLQTRITQVQEATQQLQALRSFVDNSLSNMSDGMLVTDTLGQVLIANARAAWYLRGDDNAQLIGASLSTILNELYIRDGGHWIKLIQIALLEQTRVQATMRHRDGRDLLVQIAPLTPNAAHTRGLILNFSDISPLTASERKRDELLNFLSHDLRSPLVSLLALIELSRKKNSVAEIRMELQRMQSYTDKTLNLAEQFLQLARAEGAQERPFYDVDLVNIVINSCEQVWAQAQAHSIQIVQQIEVDDAWVHGDGSLLERAIVNLLTNAVKYSHTQATVTISLRRIGEHFQCCITDTGPGIPAKELPHLFDRFWHVQRRTHRGKDGAGLGLAFVDAAIRRHSGSVEVQSVVNQGSRFCLTLLAAAE